MHRLALFTPLLLTGCALFQSPEAVLPVAAEVAPDLTAGAAEVAVNPTSVPGWLKILVGVALLVGAAVSPVAYKKVKAFLGKK